MRQTTGGAVSSRVMTRSSISAIWLGLVTGVLGVLASLVPFVLELEENAGLDWLFLMRGGRSAPAEVVVVSIDGESAAAMNLHPDPDRWPRSLHADLLGRLHAAGAAVIGFDIIFDATRDPVLDLRLTEALQAAGNVILLERLRIETVPVGDALPALQLEKRVPPIPAFERAALATAPFPLPVVPVKVSQFWVFGRAHGDIATLPAMTLHAYALRAHDAFVELLHAVRPGLAPAVPSRDALLRTGTLTEAAIAIRGLFRDDPALADDLRARLAAGEPYSELVAALIDMYGGPESRYLNFYGPARVIRTIPYHEVLADDWDPAAADLRGKAVFVGFSERHQPEQQDAFYSAYSQRSGVNLSGVEIGATAFANLLERQSVRPLPIPAHLLVVFLWGFALGAALLLLPVRAGLGAAALAGPVYFGVAYQQFQAALWLPLMVPLFVQIPAALLGALGLKYAQARAHGARVRKALGYYLPARVANRIASQAGEVGASTQLLHGTCLVTDAEQYTALAENLPPQELHGLLNEYYAVLFREVELHGGFVSDVVGDSMVAVWASAEPDPAAHAKACRAALEMLRAVRRFNAAKGQLELPTRIGLHSGEVLLGDVGAESHFEYRAVGDIVSTASRIQSLNKQLDTRLLVSSETLADATGVVSRRLGRFLLVGKEVPIELHELLGSEGEVPPAELELIALFSAALETFNARRWAEAHAAFSRILERFPADGPSGFYARLGMKYLAQGPGPAWQGTVRIAEK